LSADHRIRLSADVGGTFTDVVLDTADGFVTSKVATTLQHPEQGILEGINIVLQKAALGPADVEAFIHGTTLATNALIERKGARTALITTEGFRDSLEIAYESRYDQYDLSIQKPEVLVPRYLRFTVYERVDVNGRVLRELDIASVERIVPLLREHSVEAVAIGLLHSYANPAHEQRVAQVLRDAGITMEISLSSEVCAEVREYERFMTTACNAYIQPLMASYLRALQSSMAEQGYHCPMYLMTSGGSMTQLDSAIRFPIRLVESGPSGGAVLASRIAAQLGEAKLLSFDMGGTTAKICLIDDFKPGTARNFEIARSARFQKGSGMPVRIPVVEMIEIGAGGGSIAHVDSLGRLSIGPQSAGSLPGPACYQKGGGQVTVTDADLILGKLDPDSFAEGRMPLSAALANDAIENHLQSKLGLTTLEAAAGIAEMVEENMANAARIHSVEHGANLADYSMIAFGGAGPLHALRLAQKLNINRVIVPANSSVGSAIGFLWAPLAFELVKSFYTTTHQFDFGRVNSLLDSMRVEASEVVQPGEPDEALQVRHSAFMRYAGQGHEIEVNLPELPLDVDSCSIIQGSYETQYRRLFGRAIPDRDIEILSWAVVVSVPQQGSPSTSPKPSTAKAVDEHSVSSDELRSAYCAQLKTMIDYPVFHRDRLVPGNVFNGPALVVEAQTTTILGACYRAAVDGQLNLVIDKVPA
jgi:N-methylhydantoinase A